MTAAKSRPAPRKGLDVYIHLPVATQTVFTVLLKELHSINRRILKMSTQGDTLNSKVDALKAQNDALISVAQEIKAALDAAGTGGLSDAEVQALSDRLDGLTADDAAAVTADTPIPPTPPVAGKKK